MILLGLAGIREHFSYGALRAERVWQYGFGVRVQEGSVSKQKSLENQEEYLTMT